MTKDNMNNNNILNNNNSIINNNNGKNSLRMIINGQISNSNNNNSENNFLENDKQKINKIILNSKSKEMEILKITNEILKLIEILNKKKKLFYRKIYEFKYFKY